MLRSLTILIVEELLIALELADAVAELDATVVGPLPTVAAALNVLETLIPDAAILDSILPDGEITPVALRLVEAAVPFVLHTGTGMPALVSAASGVPLPMKPAASNHVAACLAPELKRHSRRLSPLGVPGPILRLSPQD